MKRIIILTAVFAGIIFAAGAQTATAPAANANAAAPAADANAAPAANTAAPAPNTANATAPKSETEAEVGYSNPGEINSNATANIALQTISVDKFEEDGFWSSWIAPEDGLTKSRLFEGGPDGKKAISAEESQGVQDKYILGVRVDFLRRGPDPIYIRSQHAIPVAGVVKSLSVWVAGRNMPHTLWILLKDSAGRNYEIPSTTNNGMLNFEGWKQMVFQIPTQSEYDNSGVLQQDPHRPSQEGLSIVGFRIDCNPMDAFGTFYAYFDDLEAIVDMNSQVTRDADDPSDAW